MMLTVTGGDQEKHQSCRVDDESGSVRGVLCDRNTRFFAFSNASPKRATVGIGCNLLLSFSDGLAASS